MQVYSKYLKQSTLSVKLLWIAVYIEFTEFQIFKYSYSDVEQISLCLNILSSNLTDQRCRVSWLSQANTNVGLLRENYGNLKLLTVGGPVLVIRLKTEQCQNVEIKSVETAQIKSFIRWYFTPALLMTDHRGIWGIVYLQSVADVYIIQVWGLLLSKHVAGTFRWCEDNVDIN